MKKSQIENWLDTDGKKCPYGVPDNYFEDFQARMNINSARQEKDGHVIPASRWMRVKPYIAMAASFLILVSLGGFILKSVTPHAEFSEEELLAYEFDIVPQDDMEEIYAWDEGETDEWSENEILAYLEESQLDLDLIYEYLDNEE